MEKFVFLSTLLVALLQFLHCEVFTSMANMENLAHTEQYLLTSFKSYLKAEELKLVTLKKFMARVEDAHKNVNISDISHYLGNPINTFLMLRRLSIEWNDIEKLLTHDTQESEGRNCLFYI